MGIVVGKLRYDKRGSEGYGVRSAETEIPSEANPLVFSKLDL